MKRPTNASPNLESQPETADRALAHTYNLTVSGAPQHETRPTAAPSAADVGCVGIYRYHSSPHENLVFIYVHAATRAASIRLSRAVEPRSWACVCVPSVEFCYWWALMESGELVVDHHLQSMDYRHYCWKCGRDRLAHGSLGFGSN